MKLAIKPGSTSVSLLLFIQDAAATTGAGKTGLAYNTSGLKAYYVRPGSAAAAITLATQTVTGAYSSGGFVEIDATNMPGVYRFDIPDAALAAGARSVVVLLSGASGMAPLPLEISLNGEVNVIALNGDVTAAANLAKSASVIYQGAVTGATTTSTLIDSGLTQSDTDFWKGRIVIFTSGALKYQATDITGFDPATDKLTFSTVTVAPSNGDTYVIV